MTRIEISAVTGGSYPINVYVSDYYGNYETLIYTITSGNTIPPATGATLSSTFATAPAILLKMVDANGCEKIELLECRFGCSFLITIQEASCVTDITIQSSSCDVGGLAIVEASCVTTLTVADPSCATNLVVSDPSCATNLVVI
jgi:hypothetical protein